MDNTIGGEDVLFNYGRLTLAAPHSESNGTAGHLSRRLLAPSGALKIAPGRYPTIPIHIYSFECSKPLNSDLKRSKT